MWSPSLATNAILCLFLAQIFAEVKAFLFYIASYKSDFDVNRTKQHVQKNGCIYVSEPEPLRGG